MTRTASATIVCLSLAMNMLLGVEPSSAQGGGSLGLDEVLDAVKADAKLVAEIQAELKKSGLKADGPICTGFRHDNRWTDLSGARAAPYECDIGKRRIVIQADRVYFDEAARPLGDVRKANPKRADSFKESNFRWTWKALDK